MIRKRKSDYKIRFMVVCFALIFLLSIASDVHIVSAQMMLTAEPNQTSPDTQIKLTWSSVYNAAKYKIVRGLGENSEQIGSISVEESINYLTFIDEGLDGSGLTPSTPYNYTVYAYSDADMNTQIASVSAAVETADMPEPSITDAKYNINTREVTLTWVHNSRAALQSSAGTAGSADPYITSDTSCILLPDWDEDELQFEVISLDGESHSSAPSDPVTVTAIDIPVIASVYMEDGVSTIEWEDYEYVDSFELQRSRFDGSIWGDWQTVLSNIADGSTKVTDTPSVGGVYRYRLKAKSTGEYIGYSAISGAVAKPQAPAGLAMSVTAEGYAQLTWTNSQYNQSTLKIGRREVDEETMQIIATLPLSAETYTDTSFDEGAKYYYYVIAYESDNNSDISNEYSNLESPASLSLTTSSSSSIILGWTDNSDSESGFVIERRTGAGSFTQLDTVGPNITAYTDSGLQSGVVYTYRVRALFGESSYSAYSNQASSSTSSLSPPASVVVTPTSSTALRLTWSSQNGGSYETIIERRSLSEDWIVVDSLQSNVTAYNDTGLLPNTQYFYRLRCISGSNMYSSYYPDNDNGVEAYTMLGSFTLEAVSTSSNQLHLTWSNGSGGIQYTVERKTGNGDFIPVASVAADTLQWNDISVVPDAVYIYRIKSLSESGEVVYSNEYQVSNTYMEVPYDFEVTSISNLEVELTWTDSNISESGFEIWRRVSGDSTYELYDTVGRNVIKYVDEDVEEGISYYYKIRAFSIANDAYSDFTYYEWVRPGELDAPDDLAYEVLSKTRIKLTWDDNSDNESGFRIERRTGSDGTWRTIDTVSKNREYYRDYSLDDDTRYYYRVIAYSSSYNSSASSEEILVSTAVPSTPTNIKCSPSGANSIIIKWKDNSNNEDGYTIERKGINDSSYKTVKKLGANTTSYIDSWLLPGQYYYYRVIAYNEAGEAKSSSAYGITSSSIASDNNQVNLGAGATQAMVSLVSRGVIKENASGDLNPYGTISRAEFTGMVVRAFNIQMTPVGSMTDVKTGYWYYNEIMAAKNMGIISGDGSNRFYPDAPIIREDMAVITAKTLKQIDRPLRAFSSEVLEDFWDKEMISSYAVPAMASLVGEGIMQGRSQKSLAPKSSVTRAEAAEMLYRVIDR